MHKKSRALRPAELREETQRKLLRLTSFRKSAVCITLSAEGLPGFMPAPDMTDRHAEQQKAKGIKTGDHRGAEISTPQTISSVTQSAK